MFNVLNSNNNIDRYLDFQNHNLIYYSRCEGLKKLLYRHRLINNEGNSQICKEIPSLNLDFVKKIEAFLFTKYEIPSLGISFSLSEIFDELSNVITEINFVGGGLLHLLSTDFFETCLKELSINAILDPLLMEKLLNNPSDIDFKLKLKNESVSLSSIEYLFHSILGKKFGIDSYVIKNNAYNKKIIIDDHKANQFLILGTKSNPTIEFLFIKNLPRDHLFTTTSLTLNLSNRNIQPILNSSIKDSWRTILHTVLMIIDADNIETLNHLALPMYISYLSRSYICLNQSIEKIFVEKFALDFLTKESPFYDKLEHILTNIVKSHHKNSDEILILSYNLFFICQKYLDEEKINLLHNRISTIILKINLDDNPLQWFFNEFIDQKNLILNRQYLFKVFSEKEKIDPSKIHILKRKHFDSNLLFISFKFFSNLFLITDKNFIQESDNPFILNRIEEYMLSQPFIKLKKSQLFDAIIEELTNNSIYKYDSLIKNLECLLEISNDEVLRKFFTTVVNTVLKIEDRFTKLEYLRVFFKNLHTLNKKDNEELFLKEITESLSDIEFFEFKIIESLILSKRKFNIDLAISMTPTINGEKAFHIIELLLNQSFDYGFKYLISMFNGSDKKTILKLFVKILQHINYELHTIENSYKISLLECLENFSKDLKFNENIEYIEYFKNLNLFIHKNKHEQSLSFKNIFDLSVNALMNLNISIEDRDCFQEIWAQFLSTSLTLKSNLTKNIWQRSSELKVFFEGVNNPKIQKFFLFYLKNSIKKKDRELIEEIICILIKSEINKDLIKEYENLISHPDIYSIVEKITNLNEITKFKNDITKIENIELTHLNRAIALSSKKEISNEVLQPLIELIFEKLLENPEINTLDKLNKFDVLIRNKSICNLYLFQEKKFELLHRGLFTFRSSINKNFLIYLFKEFCFFLSKKKEINSFYESLNECINLLSNFKLNNNDFKKIFNFIPHLFIDLNFDEKYSIILDIIGLFDSNNMPYEAINEDIFINLLKYIKHKKINFSQIYLLSFIFQKKFTFNLKISSEIKNLIENSLSELIFSLDFLSLKNILEIYTNQNSISMNQIYSSLEILIQKEEIEKFKLLIENFSFEKDEDVKNIFYLIVKNIQEERINQVEQIINIPSIMRLFFEYQNLFAPILKNLFSKINIESKINLLMNFPFINSSKLFSMLMNEILESKESGVFKLDSFNNLLNSELNFNYSSISTTLKKSFIIFLIDSFNSETIKFLTNNQHRIFSLSDGNFSNDELLEIYYCITNKLLSSMNPQLTSNNDKIIEDIFNFKEQFIKDSINEKCIDINCKLLMKIYYFNKELLKLSFNICNEFYLSINNENEKLIYKTLNILIEKLNTSKFKKEELLSSKIPEIINKFLLKKGLLFSPSTLIKLSMFLDVDNINNSILLNLIPNGFLHQEKDILNDQKFRQFLINIINKDISIKKEDYLLFITEYKNLLKLIYENYEEVNKNLCEFFNKKITSEILQLFIQYIDNKDELDSFLVKDTISFVFNFLGKLNNYDLICCFFKDLCKLSINYHGIEDLNLFKKSFVKLIQEINFQFLKKQNKNLIITSEDTLDINFFSKVINLSKNQTEQNQIINCSANLMVIFSNHLFFWNDKEELNENFIDMIIQIFEIILKIYPKKFCSKGGRMAVWPFVRYCFKLTDKEKLEEYKIICKKTLEVIYSNPHDINDIQLLDLSILLDIIKYEKAITLNVNLDAAINDNLEYLISCKTPQAKEKFLEILDRNLAWFFNNRIKDNIALLNYNVFSFVKSLQFSEVEYLIEFNKIFIKSKKLIKNKIGDFNKFYVSFMLSVLGFSNFSTLDTSGIVDKELFKKINSLCISCTHFFFTSDTTGINEKDVRNFLEMWYSYQHHIINSPIREYLINKDFIYVYNIKLFIISYKKSPIFINEKLKKIIFTYLNSLAIMYRSYISQEKYNEINNFIKM